jgi:hypothetical protein
MSGSRVLLVILLVVAGSARAEEAGGDPKMVSGMSILGNNETPKSLYIVPWKTSEIASDTRLESGLDEALAPLDKRVFQRELEFYQVSTTE